MRRVVFIAVVTGVVGMTVPALAQEPGLEGRDDILLQTSFESDDWYTAWGDDEAPRNTSIVRDGSAFRGDGHLRVEVPAGEHYGTSFAFRFSDQGLDEPDEIYFRYAIRLGPTWTTQDGGGGKFPGFGGTYGTAGWGGRPSDGTNGWSSRMLFWQPDEGRENGDTRIGYYVYHADMQGTYGDNWFWAGGPLGPGGALEVGRWYQIEAYVRINTPGENDGILRGWVDGTQVFDRTDVRFRDTDELRIEQVWFDLYYGGNWTAPADMYVEFDNAVIAREPIGTVDEPVLPGDDVGGGTPDSGAVSADTGTAAPDGGSQDRSDMGDHSATQTPGSSTEDDGCCATVDRRASTPFGVVVLLGLLLSARPRRRSPGWRK